MRTLAKLGLAATLFFCATGYTECQYFTDTTVPSQDSYAPVAYDIVWTGEYDAIVVDGYEEMSYRMTDPHATVMAMSAAIDNGGVKKIRQQWAVEYVCCDPSDNTCTSESHQPTGTSEDAQAGGPGARVKNGMWLAEGVTPADFCSPSKQVDSFHFGWGTYAEDFFGNVKQTGSGHIYYDR
jgi:hypothetical protein